jgi:hypothetical protein
MRSLHVSRAALFLVALALPLLLAACKFHPGQTCDDFFRSAPLQPTTLDDQQTVVEDGTVAVYHGVACAQSGPGERFIKVDGQKALPRWATGATVFLNGWKLRYLGNDDHHVLGLATAITGIALKEGTLHWQASGTLSDDDQRDIDWCYHYTVIGWNTAAVNLVLDDKDGACIGTVPGEANFFFAANAGTTTALASFPTYIQNKRFTAGPIAILPRGYGFAWSDGDHHVKQLGYDLDHGEVVADGPWSGTSTSGKSYKKRFSDVALVPAGQSWVDSTYVTWETHGIFKDDDTRRDFVLAEIASGLGGPDVGVLQPPFSVLPRRSEGLGLFGSCVATGGPEPITEQYTIDDVPFEYAIPMLTGWELAYWCTDHHVLEVGAWIDDIHYQKSPGLPGKLSYKLSYVLRDGSSNGYGGRHKVTVLGLKPLAVARTGRGLRGVPGEEAK